MISLYVLRTESTPFDTVGVLFLNGGMIGFTIEPPWQDNKRNVSCIPTGIYKFKLHQSVKHGECFLIEDVPERDNILIHVGNWVSQTEGCIMPGLKVGYLNNERAVLNSAAAMDLLIEVFPSDHETRGEIEVGAICETQSRAILRRVLLEGKKTR
jgi:hypothetical protein